MSDFLLVQTGKVSITSGASVPLQIPNLQAILGVNCQLRRIVAVTADVDAFWLPGLSTDTANPALVGGVFQPFLRPATAGIVKAYALDFPTYPKTPTYVHAIAASTAGTITYEFGYVTQY